MEQNVFFLDKHMLFQIRDCKYIAVLICYQPHIRNSAITMKCSVYFTISRQAFFFIILANAVKEDCSCTLSAGFWWLLCHTVCTICRLPIAQLISVPLLQHTPIDVCSPLSFGIKVLCHPGQCPPAVPADKGGAGVSAGMLLGGCVAMTDAAHQRSWSVRCDTTPQNVIWFRGSPLE